MTIADITLFITKSLSISVSNKNLEEIQQVLKTKEIDWDLFVKISTSQLVLPAIYCNYKRKNILKFLPADLVDYKLSNGVYIVKITGNNQTFYKRIIKK